MRFQKPLVCDKAIQRSTDTPQGHWHGSCLPPSSTAGSRRNQRQRARKAWLRQAGCESGHYRLARDAELESQTLGIFLEELTGHLRATLPACRDS
jgi:hypothetical protein